MAVKCVLYLFPTLSLKIQFGGVKRVIPPGPDGYVSFSRACDIIIPLRGLKMMMMIITTRNNNRSSCSTQEHCTARHNNQMAAKGNGQASRKRENLFRESDDVRRGVTAGSNWHERAMQATGGPTGAYRLSTQLSGVFLKGNRPHRTHIPPFSCAFFFLFSFPFFYSYNPGLLNRRRAPYRPPFFTLVKSVFDWLSHGPWPAAPKSLWSRTVASFISKNDPRIWVWRNRWSITSVCVCVHFMLS